MARLNLPKTPSLVFMAMLYAYAVGAGALVFWLMTRVP